jgi:pimeloyl-ACP methyl ester carboxylesterase
VSFLYAGDPALPRVVFLHGTPGAADGWADYLLDPPVGFEAIAIDRPGFGETRPRRAVASLGEQAQAVEPFLLSRKGASALLVGHSLGAPIAARVAVDHPDRVSGLVLLAGSLDPDLEEVLWVQYLGRWFGLEWLIPRWARNANRELIALEKHLRALAERLPEVRCPVVIVHGTDDSLVPYANVAFMEKHFAANPRVEVMRLEGKNHFLPWNAEGAVRAAIARARVLREVAP